MEINKKSIIGAVVGIVVLYATVYFGGKAWKRSQDDKPIL